MLLMLSTALALDPLHTEDALPPPPVDESVPIVNGQDEPGFEQAVALGAAGYIMCTGSVITPRIVLSAAHCGAGLPADVIALAGSAYFGQDAGEPWHEARFSSAAVHPGYVPLEETVGGSLGKFDFAILVLEEEAPVEPIWFNDQPLLDEVIGTELLSVGYGITGAGQGDGGLRRSARLMVDDISPMFVISRNEGNTNQANICNGDSGGPQYYFNEATGLMEQWAVHSWGDQNCLRESGSTRTDRAADWIYEQIEAVHGTTDRCAINGHYGDGSCDAFCDQVDPDCFFDNLTTSASAEITGAGGGCSHSQGRGAGLASLWLMGLLIRRR